MICFSFFLFKFIDKKWDKFKLGKDLKVCLDVLSRLQTFVEEMDLGKFVKFKGFLLFGIQCYGQAQPKQSP